MLFALNHFLPAGLLLVGLTANAAAVVSAAPARQADEEVMQADIRALAQHSVEDFAKLPCNVLDHVLEAAIVHQELFQTFHDRFNEDDRRHASRWQAKVMRAIDHKGC